MTALLKEIIPTCFELFVSYDWQVMAPKLSLRHFMFLLKHFFGFLHNNCVGVARIVGPQATPGLLNTCITGCDEYAGN